jgi:hypothetical protein
MAIDLIESGKSLATTEIETAKAGNVAVLVLHAAQVAHGGKPLPNTGGGKASYMSITPSGLNFGQSHTPQCTSLVCYFGEAVIGIAIPNSDLKSLGQQLLALSAGGAAQ